MLYCYIGLLRKSEALAVAVQRGLRVPLECYEKPGLSKLDVSMVGHFKQTRFLGFFSTGVL